MNVHGHPLLPQGASPGTRLHERFDLRGGPFSYITGSNGIGDARQSVARVYTTGANTGDLHQWKIPDGTIQGPQTAWDLTATRDRLYGDFGSGPNYLTAFHLDKRLYHVPTEYNAQYATNPLPSVLEIWKGGLGVYGGIAGGFLGLLLFGWYRAISPLTFADAAAPGLVLGQAIGRWGNYFNQELFGRHSDLPWAIYIAPQNRPAQFADATTFHPTFQRLVGDAAQKQGPGQGEVHVALRHVSYAGDEREDHRMCDVRAD